jgi:N-acetylglucosaminyl-diphospho-decaprenol L-rhamnosyltransferase
VTACVDVVIVAYNNRDDVADAIPELCRSAEVASVVVVDHGQDGAADIAEAEGAIALRDPTNPGFGAGQNRGARSGSSPFLLLLNPDARLEPDALAAGVAHLQRRGDVAAVQGVIRNQVTGEPERSQGVELGPIHLWGRLVLARRLLQLPLTRRLIARSSRLADHVDRAPAEPVDVESLAATAVLMRREAFEGIGGFDPGYFLYGEDLDLCRRLRNAGWRLQALPHPWAIHVSGGSAATTWSRERTWWAGTLLFAATWWTPGSWAVASVAGVARAVTLMVRRPAEARLVLSSLVVDPWQRRRAVRRGLAASLEN